LIDLKEARTTRREDFFARGVKRFFFQISIFKKSEKKEGGEGERERERVVVVVGRKAQSHIYTHTERERE
jgi:hypothetical protein